MLIDDVTLEISGGHGGPGKATFFKKGRGPDGGDGGRGGDLYFEATSDLTALSRYSQKKSFSAASGEAGGSNKKNGRDAEDLILIVPVGTEIIDDEFDQTFTLTMPGERVLLCRGGIGGLGNAARANARMTTPLYAQHGLPGEKRIVRLNLKLIADFGLVGLPNAGKSSLLNALTSANAKVGNYAFTTLEPNLGVIELSDSTRKIIADVPGLIAGASSGKGLGTRFLKHIEKVPVIIHCVSLDSADPLADYMTVRQELGSYNKELLTKKEIVLLTKVDLVDKKIVSATVKKFKQIKITPLPISILDTNSVTQLSNSLG